MSENNDLLVIEQDQLQEVFKAGGTEPLLDKLRKEGEAFKSDISTPKGRSELKSFAFKFTKAKTEIVRLGKDLVDGARKTIKETDAECKRFSTAVDEIRGKARQPLTDWEAIDKDRIAKIEEELMVFLAVEDREYEDSVGLEGTINMLKAYTIDAPLDKFFMEFTAIAIKNRDRALTHLTAKHIIIKKEEDDAAEARRAEEKRVEDERVAREKEVAEKAAEKAKAEAEKAAKEEAAEKKRLADEAIEDARKEAEEKDRLAKEVIAKAEASAVAAKVAAARAERERKEEIRKAESDLRAEQAKSAEVKACLDREIKEAADKAIKDAADAKNKADADRDAAVEAVKQKVESEKKLQEEARLEREADQKHRERIIDEVAKDISKFIDFKWETESVSLDIIDAMIAGKVRHVKVVF